MPKKIKRVKDKEAEPNRRPFWCSVHVLPMALPRMVSRGPLLALSRLSTGRTLKNVATVCTAGCGVVGIGH